jgi:hypothetical protein
MDPMRNGLTARLAGRLVAGLLALPASAAPAARDPGFWHAIVDADYRLPAGESAAQLTDELIGLLGSRDPVLRDRYGYEIFAAWIYRDGLLGPAELEAARRRLCDGARTGLGDTGADSVLLRSFSLLDLSVLAAYDLKRPFMSDSAFEETLGAAITALAFAWGEDARLAAALLSVLRRLQPCARRPMLSRNSSPCSAARNRAPVSLHMSTNCRRRWQLSRSDQRAAIPRGETACRGCVGPPDGRETRRGARGGPAAPFTCSRPGAYCHATSA